MRTLTFAKRCAREILRDPINIAFGLGFPIVLLVLLSAIQAGVPVDLFRIESLAPGVSVFGLSFITLFSATLVARDRESSFLQRLYTTPLKPRDFILGYMAPLLPIAVAQSAICYLASAAMGMRLSVNVLCALLLIIPAAIFYISLGLLCGSVLGVKQVGGVCGGLLTNVSAWLSGVWFDLELVGEGFKNAAHILPFVHAVEMERAVISGNFRGAVEHMLPVFAYAAAVTVGAVWLFLRQMKRQ